VARWKFGIGEFFETLTKGELDSSLEDYRARARAFELEKARGRKYMRLNPPVTGIAVAGVLQMGGDFPNTGPGSVLNQPPQPRAGYAWAMRRMSVDGLTAGTTPDTVNLYRRTGTRKAWQFNGNNFAYTFSHEQVVFLEGETPVLISVGSFAATGVITFDADFIEVPQIELVKVS
jgi:hypothetical protein